MTITRGFKFRIYPNVMQKQQLCGEFIAKRNLYNYYLDKNISLYTETGKKMTYNQMSADLTQLKKTEQFDFLNGASSATLQGTLKNLDAAYGNFFRRLKGREVKKGFPKFKSWVDSVRYSNVSCWYHWRDSQIFLCKVGYIKVVDYIKPTGKLLSMTVTHTKTGRWYVSMCYEIADFNEQSKPESVGIDMGINHYAIYSDGTKIENPRYLKKAQTKIKRLQKQVSRCVSGSNRRQKAVLKLAKAHEKVAAQRLNFSHQLSSAIIHHYGNVFIERLNIKGMLKNHKMARSINDVSWSEFFRQLEYKGEWYNTKVTRIGMMMPSSKTCHFCGYYYKELTLSTRQWVCDGCGETLDRDVNAAINILMMGQNVLSTLTSGEVQSPTQYLCGEESSDTRKFGVKLPSMRREVTRLPAAWHDDSKVGASTPNQMLPYIQSLPHTCME